MFAWLPIPFQLFYPTDNLIIQCLLLHQPKSALNMFNAVQCNQIKFVFQGLIEVIFSVQCPFAILPIIRCKMEIGLFC